MVTRECIECGTTFEAARHNVKVCSDACRKKRNAQKSRRYYHRKKRECPPAPKVFAPRDCAICEAAFDPSVEYTLPHGGLVKRNTGRMYCSDECATEAILRKLRNPIASRECEKCGTAFETNIPHRRFCEVTCRREFNGGYTSSVGETKECKGCENTFEVKNSQQLFCTNQCKVKYHRINTKHKPYAELTHTQKINARVRASVRGHLRKRGLSKTHKTFDILGYIPTQLMHHLESQFVEGMSWDNMSEWHIDHIRPVASFTFNSVDDPEFKACWVLENLQPLWAFDNMSKGAKWEGAQ